MINRKTLLISTLVLALIALSVMLGRGIIRKAQLDTSSQVLVLETIEGLLKVPERQAMLLLMSDDNFDAQSKESSATRLTNLTRAVGVLKTINSVTGSSDVPLLPLSRPPTASYQFDLSMLAGPITLTANLVWITGNWQFASFSFGGDLLLN
jgi:hypothetical protein